MGYLYGFPDIELRRNIVTLALRGELSAGLGLRAGSTMARSSAVPAKLRFAGTMLAGRGFYCLRILLHEPLPSRSFLTLGWRRPATWQPSGGACLGEIASYKIASIRGAERAARRY